MWSCEDPKTFFLGGFARGIRIKTKIPQMKIMAEIRLEDNEVWWRSTSFVADQQFPTVTYSLRCTENLDVRGIFNCKDRFFHLIGSPAEGIRVTTQHNNNLTTLASRVL